MIKCIFRVPDIIAVERARREADEAMAEELANPGGDRVTTTERYARAHRQYFLD